MQSPLATFVLERGLSQRTKEESMVSKMKVKTVISAVSAFALAGFFAGAAFAQGPPVNMQQGKFETAQQKNAMKAFTNKKAAKTDAEAKQLGDKLFKHARASESVQLKDDKTDHLIHVGRLDPSAHFRIDKKTGDFSFNKGLKDYMNDKETLGLPQGDKAVEMAKKHLTDLGEMPEKQEEMVVRHIGGLKQVDLGPDGNSVEKDKLVTVQFGRKIDGIDVGGPGSKIIVELGANGELVAMHKRWIETQEEKKGPPDFALEFDVKNKLQGKMKEDGANAKMIESGAPAFGYFDDGAGNIEPAYFVDAEITYDLEETPGTKTEHKEKYLGVVSALKTPKGKFDQLEKAKTPPGKSKAAADKDLPSVKD